MDNRVSRPIPGTVTIFLIMIIFYFTSAYVRTFGDAGINGQNEQQKHKGDRLYEILAGKVSDRRETKLPATPSPSLQYTLRETRSPSQHHTDAPTKPPSKHVEIVTPYPTMTPNNSKAPRKHKDEPWWAFPIQEKSKRTNQHDLWPIDWTDLTWVRNKSIVSLAAERQRQFLANPAKFRPQPVIYRPILGGMGWGNLVYDISFHVIFAMMLERPLLLMLDKKDKFGKLGWDAATSSNAVFHHRVFDWRWGSKHELLKLYPPEKLADNTQTEHEHVSCRAGLAFHKRCGGDQHNGNLEPLLNYFRSVEEKPLYSEYSASFILPLKNAPSFQRWLEANVGQGFESQLRFAFNLLFAVNSTFRENQVVPHLRNLTQNFSSKYITLHIRTGHMETGISRSESLSSDESTLRECLETFQKSDHELRKSKWLLLTDNAELAIRLRDIMYTTVTEDFSLNLYHVGYSKADNQGDAWEISLRDWMLLVESTGPILLRSRMSSAFSYGQRGAFLAGMRCSPARNTEDILASCGVNFFDEMCMY